MASRSLTKQLPLGLRGAAFVACLLVVAGALPAMAPAALWTSTPKNGWDCKSSANGCVSHTGFRPNAGSGPYGPWWGQARNITGNCTAYVAFRLIKNRARKPAGPRGISGGAVAWKQRVIEDKGLGKKRVNGKPAIGAVAWWSYGHVAYVEKIVKGTVYVSDSSWPTRPGIGGSGRYTLKRIDGRWRSGPGSSPVSAFLHIKDKPAGKSRKPAGKKRKNQRSRAQIPPAGLPSPSGATVDVAAGPGGQLALAAVKKTGTLYTRTGQIGAGWSDFYKQGVDNSWATAAIAVGADGKYRLLATKKDGTLYYRIGTPGKGWSSFDPVGVAGSWSPTEAPDLVAAADGQLLMAATKKSGTLYTRGARIGVGWGDFVKQGVDNSWATASVAIGSDGRYRLLATKKDGDLYYRIGSAAGWNDFERLGIAGSWAHTEQPDVVAGPNGALFLAAVKKTGTLYTRTGQIGAGWSDFYKQGVDNSWATAAIAVGADGKYRLLATKKDGTLHYRIGTPGSGWGSFSRTGVERSWAPTAQSDLVAGAGGQLLLAAVKRTGTLYTRTGQIGAGWSNFFPQGVAGSWATYPPTG